MEYGPGKEPGLSGEGPVACVREWIANIFFYTKNGTTIMIDAGCNYARLQEKKGFFSGLFCK